MARHRRMEYHMVSRRSPFSSRTCYKHSYVPPVQPYREPMHISVYLPNTTPDESNGYKPDMTPVFRQRRRDTIRHEAITTAGVRPVTPAFSRDGMRGSVLLTLAALMLIVTLGMSLSNGIRANQLRNELAGIQQEIDAQRIVNEQLVQEVYNASTDTSIRYMAAQQGMVDSASVLPVMLYVPDDATIRPYTDDSSPLTASGR